jgi:phosphogluconate dehydratase
VLGALQDRGFRVALVTDGRMSGASGKVLAAIHVIPEAVAGGPIAKVRDGDMVRVDSVENRLDVISPADWVERAPSQLDLSGNQHDYGRELFRLFRQTASSAEEGASPFPDYDTL